MTRAHKSNAPEITAPETGSVWRVNLHFFLASIFALIAWAMWPTDAINWGFGLISIAGGLTSFHHVQKGLAEFVTLVWRKGTVRKQTKGASETKLARKITPDVLKDAGMKQ